MENFSVIHKIVVYKRSMLTIGLLLTHDSGGNRGNGAISFVAILLGNSVKRPNFLNFRRFAMRWLDLSINAACILVVFTLYFSYPS